MIFMRLSFCLFALLSLPALANVTITVNQQRYNYSLNPRLADVLAPVALQQNWYWPAAALYRANNDKPEYLRQQILTRLQQLLTKEPDGDKAQALRALQQQLLGWKLAERIVLPVDFDLARIKASANPRFDDGEYILQLTERPRFIFISGLLKSESSVPHRGAAAINEYLAGLHHYDIASKDNVYIIEPNGNIKQVPIAYWNNKRYEIMPGGQLFVPFTDTLIGNDLAELNTKIAELAVHRILP